MTDQEINEAVARKLGVAVTVGDLKEPNQYNHDYWDGLPRRTDKNIRLRIPDYCTDIKAAWEVAEKFEQFDLKKNWDSGKWTCGIGTWGNGMNPRQSIRLEAEADTAPMAICMAFLKLP